MRLPDVLQTERLILRGPRDEDAAAIFSAYAQDPDVTRFMMWRPHEHRAQTEAFIAFCRRCWDSGQRFPYVLTRAGEDRALGMIDADIRGHTVDVGYVLRRSEWGKGLMSEALHALVPACFQMPHIHRIQATCDIDNIGSARVLQNCGFIREGRLGYHTVHPNLSEIPRPCFLYAIYRDIAC